MCYFKKISNIDKLSAYFMLAMCRISKIIGEIQGDKTELIISVKVIVFGMSLSILYMQKDAIMQARKKYLSKC